MTFENFSPRQKNRAALHRDVRAISTETCHFLGLDITKPSMDIITELVYKKIALYGSDLEAFARHAKRSTISADDVKLLVRRNRSLKEHLSSLCNNTTIKKQRRKTTNKSEGIEKVVETKKNETSKVDDNTMEMETDIEVFTNTTRKEINNTEKRLEGEASRSDLEMNATIDLTFD